MFLLEKKDYYDENLKYIKIINNYNNNINNN